MEPEPILFILDFEEDVLMKRSFINRMHIERPGNEDFGEIKLPIPLREICVS